MLSVGQTAREVPTALAEDELALRVELIREEFAELVQAATGDLTARVIVSREVRHERPDLPATADALADLLYVLLGWAVAAGIDLGRVFDLVHTTNMAKLAGPVRPDGKRLKPRGWAAPNIEGELVRQGWRR